MPKQFDFETLPWQFISSMSYHHLVQAFCVIYLRIFVVGELDGANMRTTLIIATDDAFRLLLYDIIETTTSFIFFCITLLAVHPKLE